MTGGVSARRNMAGTIRLANARDRPRARCGTFELPSGAGVVSPNAISEVSCNGTATLDAPWDRTPDR